MPLAGTTIEDLPVELFYEIFAHFQFDEVFDIFSHLNSITHIYHNGMSVTVLFHYVYQTNQLLVMDYG